jgi:hypothetical protein
MLSFVNLRDLRGFRFQQVIEYTVSWPLNSGH